MHQRLILPRRNAARARSARHVDAHLLGSRQERSSRNISTMIAIAVAADLPVNRCGDSIPCTVVGCLRVVSTIYPNVMLESSRQRSAVCSSVFVLPELRLLYTRCHVPHCAHSRNFSDKASSLPPRGPSLLPLPPPPRRRARKTDFLLPTPLNPFRSHGPTTSASDGRGGCGQPSPVSRPRLPG